jgi:hypothetical protein
LREDSDPQSVGCDATDKTSPFRLKIPQDLQAHALSISWLKDKFSFSRAGWATAARALSQDATAGAARIDLNEACSRKLFGRVPRVRGIG